MFNLFIFSESKGDNKLSPGRKQSTGRKPCPSRKLYMEKTEKKGENVKKGCVYIYGGRIKAIAPTDAKNAMKIMHVTWQKI